MDPLTLLRHAFHLALLAKTHASTLDLLVESIGRETKETKHNVHIFARKKKREERKRRETWMSCGHNSRYFFEITILTRVL